MVLILDVRVRPVAAARSFGMPAAFLVLEFDLLGLAGDLLLSGGGLRGGECGGVGRERLGKTPSTL